MVERDLSLLPPRFIRKSMAFQTAMQIGWGLGLCPALAYTPRKLGVSSSQLGTVTFAGTQELQLSSTNFLSIYPISITVCIMEDSKVCLFSPLLPWKGLKPVNNHLSLGNIFLPRFSMRLSGLVHTWAAAFGEILKPRAHLSYPWLPDLHNPWLMSDCCPKLFN